MKNKQQLLNHLNLSQSIVDKILMHAGLVVSYNKRINLISTTDESIIIEKHTLDALIAFEILSKINGLHIDMGSGSGFPVIPLACAIPHREFIAIEPRKKRVTFLNKVRMELSLSNFSVFHGKSEEFNHKKAHSVSCRALSDIETDWNRAKRLLVSKGTFITFKSQNEIIPEEFSCSEYSLPKQNKNFLLVHRNMD
jgi:16S rRNA (guanine527-N7)-methyltransferase